MDALPQRGVRSLVAMMVALVTVPVGVGAQEMTGNGTTGLPSAASPARAEPAPSGILGVEWRPEAGEAAVVELPRGIVGRSTAVFTDRQLRFPRVRTAYEARADRVRQLFADHGTPEPAGLLFRVFKREQLMEVWVRGADDPRFSLLTTYAVCGMSGTLGPKREKGDEQIPEGFYTINVFNPTSNYHLSLGVDYPNAVDRARGGGVNLGGDIFIHGGCATVGCVPITDEGIEEVYLMAMMALDGGQAAIPVHIFPTRMDEDGFAWLRDTYGSGHRDFGFWQDLREGYLAFERIRSLPAIDHHRGRYSFPRGVAAPD
jgi:murein L,D-transpeptidase YafK